jgi:outer membrane protein
MKNLIGILLGFVLCVCLCLPAYGADTCKIGVVDMTKFQEQSVAFKKLSEAYAKKLEPMRKELEQNQAELARLEEDLRKQGMMLSLDAKEDRAKDLGKKARRFEYMRNEFQQTGKELQVEALRDIGGDIQKIVQKIGAREGYDVILEKRAVGFLYNNEKIDITDEVVKDFDQLKK